MRQNIIAILLGVLSAFLIMMSCEFINSLLYPFPQGMDIYNPEILQAFTKALPVQAFFLVLLGWAVGSFAGGFVTAWYSQETTYHFSAITGIILLIFGIINHLMIGHPLWMNLLGLPLFIVFSFLGYTVYQKTFNTSLL